MITSDQIRPKKWISWIVGNGTVRTFGRREGGEYFPTEYQLTKLIVSFREGDARAAAGVRLHQ